MKKIFICSVIISLSFTIQSSAQNNQKKVEQKTWTYTYLKAKDNEKKNLKEYLIRNWFVLDSIAVSKGMFNDYKLLENTKKDTTSDWDYIVAVEYFTAGTYSDIEKEWQNIRENHKTVLIDGKGMKELGSIVKSEILIDAFKKAEK